ncbi:dienelactone hydrolase family protein [Sphingomonas sp. dw_22]|uniref:dienelactone hydrolase family protein n=1 Tax=Sphingomonas sp. dw_22 TaxID=2721175 RepID=UPI001BD6042A|nr:dienelactone hydrolase family protein [Sphingomonas sp. dw_22]
MDDIRSRAIRIYDAFTHEHRDRRALLREMAALAGSVAAAETLIAGIAASPAAAQQVPENDDRLVASMQSFTAEGINTHYYHAQSKDPDGALPVVMVIHENRGLNAHIKDVCRRLALAGFIADAPDFLSPAGGTPADEDKARDLIGQLDMAATVATGVRALKVFAAMRNTNHRIGVVGFCWGGAMANRLAIAAGKGLDAGVAYYGPAPDPAEAARVQAPLLLHYAGNDTRVNATGEPWVAALKAAGKSVEAFTYPGVEHAFNNDTSAERYNAAAAGLAWDRTIAFFHKQLDSPA